MADLRQGHAGDQSRGIIGMRYDANEIMDGITEVLAYGTAVQVQPVLAWLRGLSANI